MKPQCPVCGGSFVPHMTMPVDAKTSRDIDYGDIFRCTGCRYGCILPRPTADEIAGFYALDAYYTQGKSHFAPGGEASLLDRLRVHLAWRVDKGREFSPEMLREHSGDRTLDICDIGCGGGDMAARFAAAGHRVVCVELDPAARAQARQKGLTVHEGGAENLPEAARAHPFDVVIMSHVLEHTLEPVRALQSVGSILRAGGLFVCLVPNNASLGAEQASLAWEHLDAPRHLNFFDLHNLSLLVRASGFEVRKSFFNGYCRQFDNALINTERRIGEFIARSKKPARPTVALNSRYRAWQLLLHSAWAQPERKYDSLGIIAEKVA